MKKRTDSTLVILAVFLIFAVTAQAQQVDKDSGLIIDKGFETVKANCTVCHSARLIIQNRLDREVWLETIRWMQQTQGLWDFDPDTEKEILDYLSSHYAPRKVYRRPPLHVEWE